MALKVLESIRNAWLDAIKTAIDAGSGDIQLNSVAISAGGIISVTSGILTAGNA